MLPLDLHVLSLSLAFILSQDQTLRCSNLCLCSRFRYFRFKYFTDGIHSKYLYYCCICKFLKELFSIVSFETWCKGKDFYFYLPNIFRSFFRFIFSEVLSERLQDIRLDLPTSSLGFYLSEFPNPSFIMSPPPLSRLRVQKYCCKTYNPNISPTFLQLFFTLLDCQRFINTPSPFFWLPLFLLYFTFPNSQFSILHFQKAGVFLSIRAGFSAKDAGFFSFYAYLLKTNKRESISILVGFTFDSRLS